MVCEKDGPPTPSQQESEPLLSQRLGAVEEDTKKVKEDMREVLKKLQKIEGSNAL